MSRTKQIVGFIGKVLNVLEHARLIYRRVRNIEQLEKAERAIQIYKTLYETSCLRHAKLRGWIEEAAARRDRITEGSVQDAINDAEQSDSGPSDSR